MELTTGQTPPTEVSAAVFQRTEGILFFMTSRAPPRYRAGGTTYGTSHTSLPVLPHTVRRLIEQRLATVSGECQQMLTAAAVTGA